MRPLLSLPLVLALAGCPHQEEKKDPPVAAQRTTATPPPAVATTPTPSCSSDVDCKDGQLCVRSQCVDITNDLAECSSVRVGFNLDSDQLDSSATDALQRSARCLKADHSLHVTVEGNADERGTEEYNMALGDRRANAVEHYLESLGASKKQLRTVSYGKERPLCTEHDEACWSRNRRADLTTAAAGTKRRKGH
jgi:peptidoglycan-associated lipoprotein